MIDAPWYELFAWFFLLYWVVITLFYLVLLATAIPELRTQRRLQYRGSRQMLGGSDQAPSIAAILPAYNEEAAIVASTRSALALDYPDVEIVVVNDGSDDATLSRLLEVYEMVDCGVVQESVLCATRIRAVYRSARDPRLVVIDKDNGGKADALNAGLDWIDTELFLAVDSDTLVAPKALGHMVRPFLAKPDTIAVGGLVKVLNGSRVARGQVVEERTPRRPLWGLQMVEYMRDFILSRLGLNRMGGNLIVSGALGLFRTRTITQLGGYARGCLGEDMELVTRIVRTLRPTRGSNIIDFIYDAVAWTEVPTDIGTLRRQRERWHIGLLQILSAHRRLLFSWRARGAGLLVFPSYLFVGALAPVVEMMALVSAIGVLAGGLHADWTLTAAVLLVALGIGSGLNLIAVILDEYLFDRPRRLRDRALLLLWGLLEPFGYRQLTAWFRWRGMWRFLRGDVTWGRMRRAGTNGE